MLVINFFVLILTSIGWLALDIFSFRKSSLERFHALAEVIAFNATSPLQFEDPDAGLNTLEALAAQQEVRGAALYDHNGKLFTFYSPANEQIQGNFPPNLQKSDSGDIFDFWHAEIITVRPILYEDEFIGLVYIKADLRQLASRLQFAGFFAVIVILVASLACLWAASKFQVLITNPINRLLSSIIKVSEENDFSIRVNKESDDETGKLVDEFNRMLQHLQHRDQLLSERREQLEEKVAERTVELQQANSALAESEERIRSILETAADGIITFDTQLRIQSFNHAAMNILGYDAETIHGLDFCLFFADVQNVNRFKTLIHKVCKQGRAHEELVGLRRNGESFPMELSLAYVENAEHSQITAIVRDVTERKEFQRQLIIARDEAQHAARAKADFLANMSHEIRTPMNGIIGATEIILKTSLDSEQKEYFSIIRNSADALLRIINNILDFSKIDAGHLELEQTPFSLSEFLLPALGVVGVQAEKLGITFQINFASEIPKYIVGDPHRLAQILINLTGNAVKFTPPKGEIHIKARTLESGKGQILIQFEVSDTGPGIPDEAKGKIFEEFSQADSSSTRRYGGTGLGLAISANLVSLMGGKIWVESEVGQGSTFFFTAQFGQHTGEGIVVHPESTTELREEKEIPALKLLLVEDNYVNQRIACKMFRQLGHTVEVAESGEVALEILSKETFDIVFMDCQMPGMDGFETTMHIRSNHPSSESHIPIVAMTAHARKEDREKCLEVGMDDYLSKPFHQSDLIEIIAKIYDRFIDLEGTPLVHGDTVTKE